MTKKEDEILVKGPKNMPTKANSIDYTPTGNYETPNYGGNNEQPLWKNTLNNIWADTKEVLPDFLNGLTNINNNNAYNLNNTNNFSNYSPKVYPLQNDSYQLPNQNFSTFNMKSTKDMIKESTNNIENVLKKPEINLNDMNLIRTMASNSISGLCKDCKSVVEQRRNQPSIPTWESAQLGKEIDDKRLSTMDNAVNGIIMLNLMDNALDNKFKKINQTDPYYAQRLQEHTREKEINKNLKDMIMNLSYSMNEPNEDTLVLTNKLKETLTQPIQPQNQFTGVPTGGANNIKNNSINKINNYINHVGENGYPIWFLPEPYEEKWKILLCDNFIGYGRLWRETNIRLEKFYKRPDINITDDELDIKNDMRHITGLAFFTQLFGVVKTISLGYMKEFKDMIFEHDFEDTKIDIENNKRGIYIGQKYPFTERDKLIEIIYNIYIKHKRKNK